MHSNSPLRSRETIMVFRHVAVKRRSDWPLIKQFLCSNWTSNFMSLPQTGWMKASSLQQLTGSARSMINALLWLHECDNQCVKNNAGRWLTAQVNAKRWGSWTWPKGSRLASDQAQTVTSLNWTCIVCHFPKKGHVWMYSIDCSGMRPQTYAGSADNERACQDITLHGMDI